MSAIRPGLYPYHDINGVNLTAPENSNYLFVGYPVGLPVPSADHNGKLQRNGAWHEYLDRGGLRNDDWLDTATDAALTITALTYNAGGNVLTTGATVNTRGIYLVQGTRVETDEALLNPIGGSVQGEPLVYPTATVPGRIWIYASASGQPRFESVGPAVADSPGSGEITLVGLDVDALGVVTDGAVVPVTLPLPPYVLPIMIDIESGGDISAVIVTADRLVVNGGVAGAPSAAIGPTAGQPSLQVTGNGTQAALTIPSTAGPGISAVSSGAVAAITGSHFGSGDCFRALPNSSGRGMSIEHTGTGVGLYVDTSGSNDYAIDAVGPSGGDVINATCDTGNAFRGVATGAGMAFRGLGGASALSRAVLGISSHVDAFAIEAQTAGAATANCAAIYAQGFSAGHGLYAIANGTGYGAIIQADVTSPVHAALRLPPQDDDPSSPDQGDFLFNSSRGPTGKNRTYTTQWESVHSSSLGWVRAWGVSASGTTAGSSGNISLALITPEEIGDVLVTVTASLRFSVDNGACTLEIWDVTLGAQIASQIETSSDPAGNATNLGIVTRSAVIRLPYTLPSTASRTFAARITATTGSITFAEVVCSVEGVQ